jgi:hypothetical protein
MTYRTIKDGLAVVLILEKDDDLCDGLVGAVRGGYEQSVALTLLTVQGRLKAQHTRELVNAKQRKKFFYFSSSFFFMKQKFFLSFYRLKHAISFFYPSPPVYNMPRVTTIFTQSILNQKSNMEL